MNLPLRWDRGKRRRRHGGTVEAEHNAVGVKAPHAGIHHMQLQSPFGSRREGGAVGLIDGELDPALAIPLPDRDSGHHHLLGSGWERRTDSP